MKKYLLLLAVLAFGVFSCTNLEEEIREDITGDVASEVVEASALLNGAYEGLRSPYQNQDRFWAAQEHTADATMGPTRGPDWDDNGIWRSLHNHTWSPTHDFLSSTFSELLQVVFNTTNLLQFNPSPQQAAEARFLRAFVMLSVVDGWGQVPFREAGSDLLADAQVLQAAEAVQFVIDECTEIMGTLPDGPAHKANQDAAKVLMMKAYLNKGAYINRTDPSFDPADMNQVIALADELINSGKYMVADNYFDNFAPNNDQISTENIFTALNEGGTSSGNVRSRWFCTMHYNQFPSGWNGFTTLSNFYDAFEEDDMRRSADYEGMTDVYGTNAGFLVGQQVGPLDTDGDEQLDTDASGDFIIYELEDRNGNPLAFTPEVAIQESGSNLEVTGIRVVKYPIDYNNAGNDHAENDYVFYRFADVWLMKAEAAMRNGDNATALDMVNTLRTARGATALSAISADEMLAERGRELYWEGHRRTDLIRFGKFLDAWQEKPASGTERLLFPIPATSLASNPNLVQNPGY